MPGWRVMLGGLLVWAAHFFTLYVLASVFGSTWLARAASLVATAAAIGIDVVLVRALRRKPATDDGVARWMRSLGMLGVLISIIAVLWQGLPAIVA